MIKQANVSKSVHDFPFHRLYSLNGYFDKNAPTVFFGCYNNEDFLLIKQHQGLAVIWWCGQDALDFKEWSSFGPNVHHVTERKKVFEHIKQYGCKLLPVSNLAELAVPVQLGPKIFAYCSASFPEYHGIEILNELKARGHDIIIGDGSIPQDQWRAGRCNEYYEHCFIGLVLSHFAGGGASVIELGVRGIKCVTNVLELGNVINWETIEDIEHAIATESKKIGSTCNEVARETTNTLDLTNNFLKLDNYGM